MLRVGLKIILVSILLAVLINFSYARQEKTASGRIIVCLIRLEHADAMYLADVLKPFLSPEGSLTPYEPTNTLVIKDRESVVNMLSEIIKGEPCTPVNR